MTDEELMKYASRAGFDYVDNIVQENPGHRWNDHDVEYAYRDGILAGAEWKDRSLNWIRDLVKAAIKKPDEAQGILERIDRMLNKEEEQ